MDSANAPVVVQQVGIDLKDWSHPDLVIRTARRCLLLLDIRCRMLDENADAWELIGANQEVLARGTLSTQEILKK